MALTDAQMDGLEAILANPKASAEDKAEALELLKEAAQGDPMDAIRGAALEGDGAQILHDYMDTMDAENVQHPEISAAERMLVKNLAATPKVAAQHLQKAHPNLRFLVNTQDNEIYIKGENDEKWAVLDPDMNWGNFISTETLQDLGDVLWDVPAAFASGAAQAKGGIAGATLGAPLGPIGMWTGAKLGAGMAGAAVDGGLETARQFIGQELGGIENNIDGNEIKSRAATGAISPLLFGTGGSASKKALATLTPEALEKLANAQRGIPGTAYSGFTQRLFPWATEMLTNIPAQATKTLINHGDKVREMGANPDIGLQMTADIRKQVETAFQQNYRKKWDHLKSLYDAAMQRGDKRTINAVLREVDNDIRVARAHASKAHDVERAQALPDGLEWYRDTFFMGNAGGKSGPQYTPRFQSGKLVTPQAPGGKTTNFMQTSFDAHELDMLQRDMGDLIDNPGGIIPENLSAAEKNIQARVRQDKGEVIKQLESMDPQRIPPARREYGVAREWYDDAQKYTGSDQATYNAMLGLDAQGKKVFKGRLNHLMTPKQAEALSHKIDLLQAESIYGKPKMMPVSRGGTTSTSVSVPAAMAAGSAAEAAAVAAGLPAGAVTAARAMGTQSGNKLMSPATVAGIVRGGEALKSVVTPENYKYLNKLPGWKALLGKRAKKTYAQSMLYDKMEKSGFEDEEQMLQGEAP